MSTLKTIYQVKVTLIGSKPPVWRKFLIADTTTLHRLHSILQTVMGWTTSHLEITITKYAVKRMSGRCSTCMGLPV